MQGRLSPLVGGRIQAFPVQHWREEFALAQRHGFSLMEWTLDHEGLRENPLMTSGGRAEIGRLSARHGVAVSSITADCFMQAPFFKSTGSVAQALKGELERVIEAAAELGVRAVVLPLVDNGHIESLQEAEHLRDGLKIVVPVLRDSGISIMFESDFAPEKLRRFIGDYPARHFGINYDIGNSAGLGFDPNKEISTYGDRIGNVHVKDRVRAGGTVPLGTGAAELPLVFELLKRCGYQGNYILQTARAEDGRHEVALCRYRDMVEAWLGGNA